MDAPLEEVTATSPSRALTGAVVGGLVVLLLGAGVWWDYGPQLRLDAAVSTALYAGDDRPAWAGGLLEVLTAPGSSVFRLVVYLPVLLWLARRRAWRTALWVFTVSVSVGLLTTLIKELVGRARPDFAEGGARLDTLSYPSGHASGIASMVAVALILAWPHLATSAARRGWLVAGIALVVLVGLTRMWLGVHYLSDVVGGWAFGTAWTLLTAVLFGALPGGRAALRPAVRAPG